MLCNITNERVALHCLGLFSHLMQACEHSLLDSALWHWIKCQELKVERVWIGSRFEIYWAGWRDQSLWNRLGNRVKTRMCSICMEKEFWTWNWIYSIYMFHLRQEHVFSTMLFLFSLYLVSCYIKEERCSLCFS